MCVCVCVCVFCVHVPMYMISLSLSLSLLYLLLLLSPKVDIVTDHYRYTYTGLSPNSLYYYAVQADISGIKSVLSDVINQTTRPVCKCACLHYMRYSQDYIIIEFRIM